MMELEYIQEPKLLFAHEQAMEDPRDGLSLFGPLHAAKPYGIRFGVVGTKIGIARFSEWVQQIQHPLAVDPPQAFRPPFPGFETAFRIPWRPEPDISIEVPADALTDAVHITDKHQRVYEAVGLYEGRIRSAIRDEDVKVDLWFVIVPDDVYRYCRPKSNVEPGLRVSAPSSLNLKTAKRLFVNPSLFEEDNVAAVPYQYEVNFHNQLKARLLEYGQPIQVVRESTVAQGDGDEVGGRKRRLDAPSTIAWNISTAVFYKAGGRPWKMHAIRDGVCYIGLVFKHDERSSDIRSACCAAQMFLDSGDGLVFKGAVGPWFSPDKGDYHMTRKAARELVALALQSYKKSKGSLPKELFIHGRVRFDYDEWNGFRDAVGNETALVGIRIREFKGFKLFRKLDYPVMRGLAYIKDSQTAFLWSRGFVPRLGTYVGMEVPNPLLVDVARGQCDIRTVMEDILALTKLNYNACLYADGLPVTLRFADSVGEILTAGPITGDPPLPFRYYI